MALGADLLDKNKLFLNSKNVRNVTQLLLVAVNLYRYQSSMAYIPPMDLKEKKEEGGNDEMMAMIKATAKMKKGVLVQSVVGGGFAEGTNVTLKKEDNTAYKAPK